MKTILNPRRQAIALCLCVVLCAFGSATLYAQPGDKSATLSGSVLDVTGRAIANAAISVTNEAGGALHQTITDDEGKFSIAGLPEGSYTVTAAAPGFSNSRRTGVKLTAEKPETISM